MAGPLPARTHARAALPCLHPWFMTRLLPSLSLAVFSEVEESTEASGGGQAWPLTACVAVGSFATVLSFILPVQNRKAEPASQSGCERPGDLSQGGVAPRDACVLVPSPGTHQATWQSRQGC